MLNYCNAPSSVASTTINHSLSTFDQREFESVHVGSRHWRDSVLRAASLPSNVGIIPALTPSSNDVHEFRGEPRVGFSAGDTHFHWNTCARDSSTL